MSALSDAALNQLFLEARTHNGWQDQPVSDETLRKLYQLTAIAPTSSNTSPGRFVFVRSPEAKQRLAPAMAGGNLEKTMAAPVTAIVAYDVAFHEQMPVLFPARDMKSGFAAMAADERSALARLNGTLEVAYLIVAARALGLDTGPMLGFDSGKVDAEFFAGTSWKSLVLVNLGVGDPDKLWPRNPRLDFDVAAKIL